MTAVAVGVVTRSCEACSFPANWRAWPRSGIDVVTLVWRGRRILAFFQTMWLRRFAVGDKPAWGEGL